MAYAHTYLIYPCIFLIYGRIRIESEIDTVQD